MGALAQVPRAFSPVAAEHAQWPRLRLTDASHGLSRPAVESGGVVGARKLLASDEYLGATAEEPGSMHPSERSCWTRRVVRQGRTLVRSRGWQVGSAGSSKRNLQRCMPRRGRSNDARARFQRRVQRRAGRALNRAVGPHRSGRTRPAASATGAAQGTATTADLPAAIGFRRSRQPGGAKPRWHGPERAPSPAGCAVGRTVGRRPASARAARTRLVRPVVLVSGFRPAALLRDRRPPRKLTFA